MEPLSVPWQPSRTAVLEGLDSRVREVVIRRGFEEFSEAQLRAIPPLLAGEHLVLIAPTGTGKTESAMIPVFDGMVRTPGRGIRALYITPLRSLNRDILSRMEWWCRELGLTIGVRHGDTPQAARRRQALSPPDLLITTPETLQAMFMGSQLRRALRNVQYVIVDEIHELAGSKRGAQLSIALERLREYTGEFQRIGLSATVGNPAQVASFLCAERQTSVVEIPAAPLLSITVRYAGEDFGEQAKVVAECIDRFPSTLIFVNTRVTAEALGHALFERGDVEVHHGSLSKEVRIDAEDRFKAGAIRALICTSSMELGIDIGHVEHVIQFGSPREVARLVQRVGRAGHRLHTVSNGTILATGYDDLLESLVIARRAQSNECENVVPHLGAADVLANQIAALAVEYGEIPVRRAEEIIARAACFPDPKALIEEVCAQLVLHRLIRVQDGVIIRTARARRYLSDNLSMIHDERKMLIFDIVSRRTVGTLDESFVVAWIHTGAVFITKGQLWRVLDMTEDRIMVEPAKKAKGELPSWEGEQIPVPCPVAREVGCVRRTLEFERYTADPGSLSFLHGFTVRAERERARVPSDRLITIESCPDGAVLNTCFGHKVNEALARSLSILLSARFGTTVGIEVGAYRVLLRLPTKVSPHHVQETLLSLQEGHVAGILTLAMKRTALFRWKLVQVAKKFGAIDKDADYERISMNRLLDLFEGTIVAREAYRELFMEYMDVRGAEQVLSAVRDGSIRVETGLLSLFGREGIFSSRDVIPPPTADQAVISTLRRRLEQDAMILCCQNCHHWKSRTTVARVPERPQCPRCGARLIAAVKPWDEGHCDIAGKKQKTEDEKAIAARMRKNANLVLSYGKKAVIALAGRGVGPEGAVRILATLTEGDAFYREILKAERNFVRTHRFWQQ
ncbi:MAG: DEAD/DEAH box helicase [Methanomicrobiales archaeon]|nr:DEAD/DEAH box helicase [Methanomicrobiales archaeon]